MKKALPFIALLAALVSSCQKDDSNPPDPTFPTGRYLVKTTNTADINRYTSFEYDNAMQLASAMSYYPDGNIQKVESAIMPGYTGNVLSNLSYNFQAAIRHRFEYDQAGRLVRAYDLRGNTATNTSYDSVTYNEMGLIKYLFRKSREGNAPATLDSVIFLNRTDKGNITDIYTGSAHDSSNLQTKFTHRIHCIYSGLKQNPYYKIAFPLFWTSPEHYGFISREPLTRKE